MPLRFLKSGVADRGATWRLSVVLLAMFAAVLASKVWEDSYITELSDDCSSLYSDRLIPATLLFRLSDELHDKRHTLTAYLKSGQTPGGRSIDYELGQHDASIEHHIQAIEQTLLVADESRHLHALHESLRRYNELEQNLLSARKQGKAADFQGPIKLAFAQVRKELQALTQLQEDVGKQLNSASHKSATQVTSLLYFQLGVAFILGLTASALAMSLGGRGAGPGGPDASAKETDLH